MKGTQITGEALLIGMLLDGCPREVFHQQLSSDHD
jgi:hypothetical protein